MVTTNAIGQIVSGSQVRLPDSTQVYDVGEVYGCTAYLYIGGVFVKKERIENLIAV